MSVDFYKEFGENGYLANYSHHGFYKNGIYYPTVEHYYQSEKFTDPALKKRIIEAPTPKEASNLGRCRDFQRIDSFRNKKNQVMYEGVLEKFRQNPDIRSRLIETRNQEIREMTVKESYWGVGPHLDGENHIGKILMKVRERVKQEVLTTIIEKCRGKRVTVVGHRHPDCDSFFSGYLLTRILQSMGIDAVFAVRDEEFVDSKIIRDFGVQDYEVVDTYENRNFILVDHNLLDGILPECVIGAFDHHIISGEVDDLVEMEYASCGLLLYDLFRDVYPFSEEEKRMIALTVLTDTDYLTSSRFGLEDQQLFQSLGISLDVRAFQKKYFETTNFKQDYYDIFHSNYKEYDYHGIHIKRSLISSFQDDREKYYSNSILEIQKNDIDLLIWCDYESCTTYVFYNGHEFVFPIFTSSTTIVLQYLKEEKIL